MSCEAEIYPASEIQHLIRSLYDIKSGIVQDTLSSIEEVNDLSELVRQEVMSDTVDAPVIRLVNGLIVESLKERATDIHIEPYEDRVTVTIQDRRRASRQIQPLQRTPGTCHKQGQSNGKP